MKKRTALRIAMREARYAGTTLFSSRRGVYHLEKEDCLVLYHNNPYECDPSIRLMEIDRLVHHLAYVGIRTLAQGGYANVPGSDQPYTITLLLDCSVDRLEVVSKIGEEEVMKSFRLMDSKGIPGP